MKKNIQNCKKKIKKKMLKVNFREKNKEMPNFIKNEYLCSLYCDISQMCVCVL